MDSITIGRKKQVPGKVNIPNGKYHAQPHHNWKIHRPKQQEPRQKTEPQVPQSFPLENLVRENHPYAPLPKANVLRKSIINPANLIGINQDERLCSVRAVVATFIIIAIIIIAAGVAVGIMFASIKSQNSSGSGNTSNQNTFSTISTGLLTSSVSIGSQTGLPCSGYTEIDDPTRNYNYSSSSSSCDNGALFNISNGGSWIRFVGSGGTILPSSSPGMNHCGGFLSGWYNTTLPTVQNVTTSGTVCFETYSQLCGFAIDISVVYCPGNYYVYFLPPTSVCNLRYCTE